MQISALKSRRVIIAAKVAGYRHKLMQIMFSQKDGSIYISFPYFKDSHGLVSQVTMPKNIVPPYSVSLVPGGKVTSHRVKYSHHPDGRTHFSQDSKINTEIIKPSVPISEMNGHFFTTHIQGLHHYQTELTDKPNNKQRSTIEFDFGESEPESIKVVGRMYNLDALSRMIVGDVKGPVVPIVTDSGENGVAILIGDPVSREPEMVMMVNCRQMPKFDKNSDSSLTFMGGFDSVEVVNNIKMETTHLCLSYPAHDYDELRQKLGTVDL